MNAAAACACALLSTGLAADEAVGQTPSAYPGKPIRLILPTTPGSAFETFGRLLGGRMGQALGQPIVPDSRAGANGAIGAELVARAAPDGYTLLWATPAQTVTAYYLVKELRYDPRKDFTPITSGAEALTVMILNPSVPAITMGQFIAYARSQPGKLSYGHSGVGSVFHLMGESFNAAAGTSMVNVPYKGAPQSLNDLLAGQIQAMFTTLGTATPHWRSGKLRPIALLAERRHPGAPDLPTFQEVLPAFDMPRSWYALFGPAGLPRPLQARLHAELAAALKSQEARAWLEANYHTPGGAPPEEFAAQFAADFASWGRAVKTAGVQPE